MNWEPRFKVGDYIQYNGNKMYIKNVNLDNQTYNFVEGGTGTGEYIDKGFERSNRMGGKNIIAPAVLISSAAAGGRKRSRRDRKSKKSRSRRSRSRRRKY
jgi:hypothetical protein